MPETKYTTTIYLAVAKEDEDTAGKAAVRVFQDLLGRLRRTAPSVRDMRVEVEKLAPRKGHEGVFECWSQLKAIVPSDLTEAAAENDQDAWRIHIRREWDVIRHQNFDFIHHGYSRVEGTRMVLPGEEEPKGEAAPVEQKPKEMIAVKVVLGGKEFSVEVPKGENLLDGVNDKGVAVKWDCKSGVCDTCKIQVLKGMENLSAPNDAEQNMLGDSIKQGFRLCCQVTANGPVEIKQ